MNAHNEGITGLDNPAGRTTEPATLGGAAGLANPSGAEPADSPEAPSAAAQGSVTEDTVDASVSAAASAEEREHAAVSGGNDPATAVTSQKPATAPGQQDSVARPSLKFAQMDFNSPDRYAVTPKGTFHLTPTELLLVRTIEEHNGEAATKANLAQRLHRNITVIGRLITKLRREGIIESEEVFGQGGAQYANKWRIAPDAHPLVREDKERH